MHDTARKVGFDLPMTQLLKVRAENDTLVWICIDPGGQLFYQANSGGDEENWIEGKTALFLPNVVRKDDGYLATAPDGNRIFVDNQRLEVLKKGKKQTLAVEPE
jgi:hypothetical protein